MIWLALAWTAAILEGSSINTQCTAIIFIRLLLSTTNFPEAKLSSTFLSPIFWKYSKTLQQQPENIQRLFRLQICLSRKSSTTRKYSKTFQPAATINSSHRQHQPSTATSSSNQQQQQQQPTATTNSNNQQQQSTAAINSGNQQQHSTTTINYSNNQPSSYQHHFHNPRRPTLDNITVPSTGYVLLEVDLGLAARLRVQSPLPRTIFCDISIFLKLLFCDFSFFS